MRPEMARKLQRAIWISRLKVYGPTLFLLALCVLGGGYWYSSRLASGDPTVNLVQITGTVTASNRVASRAAIYIVHVKLDDGNEVVADSTLTIIPVASDHVTLNKATHASGKMTYHVLQVAH